MEIDNTEFERYLSMEYLAYLVCTVTFLVTVGIIWSVFKSLNCFIKGKQNIK